MAYRPSDTNLATHGDIRGIEIRIDGLEARMDGLDARMDRFETSLDQFNRRLNRFFLIMVTALMGILGTLVASIIIG